MKQDNDNNRRSFLRNSAAMSAATMGGGLLGSGISAFAREEDRQEEQGCKHGAASE